MENNKMSRVAKNLDIFANVCGKISAAAGIVCMVTALLAIAFGDRMFAGGAATLDLDFVKFHLNDGSCTDVKFIKLYAFMATLGGGIICFLVSYIAGLVRKILSPMKNGRPFEAGMPELLRKVGWAVLAGGFLSELVGVGARMLLVKAYSMGDLFASAAIGKTEFVYTLNLDFVLITCVIFFLSYIFAYGQALQQDSDETL